MDRLELTQAAVVERSGVHPPQIARLRTSAARDRESRRRQVLALARVLEIPKDEALRLAGLAPRKPEPEPEVDDLRQDIARSRIYNARQKRALLDLLDVFDESNAEQRDTG
jgi:transcriptional regulator with XRE-family HTH domain